MEAYRYKAINEQGRVRRGRVDAINPADLEVRLSRVGLDLVNYRALRTRRHGVTGRGVSRVDLISFFFHLEQLVHAGVPILDGLADLRDTVDNKRLQDVTAAMIESIEGGRNLSGAMAEYPQVFGNVMVNLVRAGEQSGQLSRVLERIIESLKWQDEQARYTQRLMMYPALVSVVILGVVIFLLIFVVPQLVSFLSVMGRDLPLQTRALIGASEIFRQWWFLVLGVPVAVAAGLWLLIRRSPAAAEAFDRLKLRVPLLGPILRKLIITRVCNVFAIMYASGITVLECVRVGEDVAGNRAVSRALRDVGRSIADGAGIGASFASSGLFPPLVVRMLRVGESTGALEDALNNVSYFYTRDVQESVARLQEMIVPFITILLSAFMFWIFASILGPIHELFTQLDL